MGRPRFIADAMLGSLARKLRLLGIDTAYIRDAQDSQLKYLTRFQGRILLTRDKNLSRKLGDLVWLVSGNSARAEFLSIAGKLSASGCRLDPFSRCLDCNEMLRPIDSTDVEGKVPPYVQKSKTHFSECFSCGKVFWKGTHSERMGEEVEWMKGVLEEGN